jgi:hypothetical protein
MRRLPIQKIARRNCVSQNGPCRRRMQTLAVARMETAAVNPSDVKNIAGRISQTLFQDLAKIDDYPISGAVNFL